VERKRTIRGAEARVGLDAGEIARPGVKTGTKTVANGLSKKEPGFELVARDEFGTGQRRKRSS